MTQYLAKPYQSYEEHIRRAYASWKEITHFLYPFIESVSAAVHISPKRFLESSLLTVVFHDIGKMCCPFQEMMQTVRSGDTPDYSKNYRHELASFQYVIQAGYDLIKSDGVLCGSVFGLEAFAVLGHHKLINGGLDAFEREMQNRDCLRWVPGGVEHAFSVANAIFSEEGFSQRFTMKKEYEHPFPDTAKFVQEYYPKMYEQYDDCETVRTMFLLLKAILQYSDWFGSAGESICFSPALSCDELEQSIRMRCSSIGRDFSGFTEFQKKCGECHSDLIATAPTGSGKTEASLLWAINGFAEGKKLIYLLPTMVTSNSLYLRMIDYFSAENVGLVHSTSSLFKESESESVTTTYSDVLREKSFMMPVTVSTVDQLLFSGFNKGYWPLVEANAANSMIVIDEIHAYDGWTLGLICAAVKHFHKLGAKFMIMSATMPQYLKDLLHSCLPDAETAEDSVLLQTSRNRYIVSDSLLENSIPEIEQEVRNGKKVLVVVNNVSLCQSLSMSLSHLHPVCYHSKFIFGDRKEKEDVITHLSQKQAGCLVVATQVVEVSLDVDFDVMFTECAPPDALVQRGGRVNRARKKTGTEVRVFRASDVSHKIYDSASFGVLDKTFSILSGMNPAMSESDLISFVEQVYEGEDISSNPDFAAASLQYAATQDRLMAILDNTYFEGENPDECTRKLDYLTETVVPLCLREEALAADLRSRKKFELKMPLWYVRKHKMIEQDILFCDMIYDSEYGAQYLRDKKSSDSQIMV